MAYRIYRSDDPGAIAAGLPNLPRSASTTYSPRSELVTILDACLVNGYDGKAAAGWTKPFPSDGTMDVYLSQSTTGFAARVDPVYSSSTSAYAINPISALINPTSLAQTGQGVTLIGTGTESGGAWIVLADEKSFIIMSKGDTTISTAVGPWQMCYFGETIPFEGLAPGTNWACVGRGFAINAGTVQSAPWSSSIKSSLNAGGAPEPRIIHPLYGISDIRIVGGPFFLAAGSAQYQVPLAATGGRVLASDVILTGLNAPICKLRGVKTLESAFWGVSNHLDVLTLDGKKYAIIYVRGTTGSITSTQAQISMFLVEVE